MEVISKVERKAVRRSLHRLVRRHSVLPIAPPCLCDRADDKLLEYRLVEIGQLLEVQANLAHPVFAKLGQHPFEKTQVLVVVDLT